MILLKCLSSFNHVNVLVTGDGDADDSGEDSGEEGDRRGEGGEKDDEEEEEEEGEEGEVGEVDEVSISVLIKRSHVSYFVFDQGRGARSLSRTTHRSLL